MAVVSHGESGRSGTGVTRSRDTALSGQFEFPYGFGGAPTYFGLITTRHMHEFGTTLEQWAQVAVSTRKWAMLNPKAKNREPLTVQDVLNSRPVVWPFNVLNICLVTDAGGNPITQVMLIPLLGCLVICGIPPARLKAIVGQTATPALGGSYQQEVDLQNLFKDVAHNYVTTVTTPSTHDSRTPRTSPSCPSG